MSFTLLKRTRRRRGQRSLSVATWRSVESATALCNDGGIRLLRQVVEAGVTLIDTADIYGPTATSLSFAKRSIHTPRNSSSRRKVASCDGVEISPRSMRLAMPTFYANAST
jgi:aryl-alcohol dehydrogenase-like predicted oxidoreductase